MKHLAKILKEFSKIAVDLIDRNKWQYQLVTHITPTGQRRQVLVKSLPFDEREKFRPTKSRHEKDVAELVCSKIVDARHCANNISKTLESILQQVQPEDQPTFIKCICDCQSKMDEDVENSIKNIRDTLSECLIQKKSLLKSFPNKSSKECSDLCKEIEQREEALLTLNEIKRVTPKIDLHLSKALNNTGTKPLDETLKNNKECLFDAFKKWEDTMHPVSNINVYLRLIGLMQD